MEPQDYKGILNKQEEININNSIHQEDFKMYTSYSQESLSEFLNFEASNKNSEEYFKSEPLSPNYNMEEVTGCLDRQLRQDVFIPTGNPITNDNDVVFDSQEHFYDNIINFADEQVEFQATINPNKIHNARSKDNNNLIISLSQLSDSKDLSFIADEKISLNTPEIEKIILDFEVS